MLTEQENAAPPIQEWLNIVVKVIEKSGFSMSLNFNSLAKGYKIYIKVLLYVSPRKQQLLY
jgi:hypothetical protein